MERDPLTLELEAQARPRPLSGQQPPGLLELIPRRVEGWSWPDWIRPGERIPLVATLPAAGVGAAGEVIAELCDGRVRRPAVTLEQGRPVLQFDPYAALQQILGERYVRLSRPIHTYGQLSRVVNLLPGTVRFWGHRVVSALERVRARQVSALPFPEFPRDRAVELLRLLARRARGLPDRPTVWPGAQAVVLLTHDVDTAEGQRLIPQVASVERRLGFCSCWYVVGRRYPLDHRLLGELRREGHEIGLHGTHHDCRLAYLSPRAMARRLDRCRPMIERHQVQGFRSPALLMTDELARQLRDRFVYDSSMPDSDVDTICAPHRGCSTVFPFYRDGLLELPLTLPLDDRLLLLGQSPEQQQQTWQQKIAWIRQVGGMIVVTTHVEPHLGASAELLAVYKELLQWLRQQTSVKPLLPRQVAQLWSGGVDDAD